MEATQTPTMVHLEFDRMCEALDEFEPLLPVVSVMPTPGHREETDETPLDQQILAGLVSPI